MTLIEVEVAVLVVVVIVAAVVLWRAADRLLVRMFESQAAMNKHSKAATREALLAKADALRAVATVERLAEDTRLNLERVDRHMGDPRMKLLLAERG